MTLLESLGYYDSDEIRRYCVYLHCQLNVEFEPDALKNAIFVGLGDAGESGQHLSYLYRTCNGLPLDRFAWCEQLPEKLGDNRLVVFLDDFVGSGKQCVKFWESEVKPWACRVLGLRFCYMALAGFVDGLKRISEQTGLGRPLVIDELTDEDRAFSSTSRAFPEEALRDLARECMERTGRRLCPDFPLGYADGQALIAFDHNTPNNTLPVIWKRTEYWIPLFERHEKRRHEPDLAAEPTPPAEPGEEPAVRASVLKARERLRALADYQALASSGGLSQQQLMNACREVVRAEGVALWAVDSAARWDVMAASTRFVARKVAVRSALAACGKRMAARHGALRWNQSSVAGGVNKGWVLIVPVDPTSEAQPTIVAVRAERDGQFDVLDRTAVQQLADALMARPRR
ncbi:MAG: hypothetical protein HYU66_28070 [Armatimonadetes bacterium]|nr:hypothetical protein [Armatimonadota bacterium]